METVREELEKKIAQLTFSLKCRDCLINELENKNEGLGRLCEYLRQTIANQREEINRYRLKVGMRQLEEMAHQHKRERDEWKRKAEEYTAIGNTVINTYKLLYEALSVKDK